jgi:hypothetical protein
MNSSNLGEVEASAVLPGARDVATLLRQKIKRGKDRAGWKRELLQGHGRPSTTSS